MYYSKNQILLMKKLILSLLVVAAFSATSFAQLSLKAGVNLANQSFESGGISFSPSTNPGFLVGANFAVNVTQSLAVRPGLQFTLKGSKFEFGPDNFKSNFSYIEVPVDLVFNSGGLSIHAGPYLGLLMSATSNGDDIKDSAKSADFGLNLGLGYRLGSFGVGANYGLGLGNISDDDTEDITIKNKVFSVYVTYTL